jgi:hypothetical protein
MVVIKTLLTSRLNASDITLWFSSFAFSIVGCSKLIIIHITKDENWSKEEHEKINKWCACDVTSGVHKMFFSPL